METVPLTSKRRDQRLKNFNLFRRTMNRYLGPWILRSHCHPRSFHFRWIMNPEVFARSPLPICNLHQRLFGQRHRHSLVRSIRAKG